MSSTRYIGAHIDRKLHTLIKIKCAEKDLTMQEAVVKALIVYLELEEEVKKYLEEYGDELAATAAL